MHKLCHPALVLTVVFSFIITACGRESYYPEAKNMTEAQAFDQINSSFNSERGALSTTSVQSLQALLEQLIKEGKIKVPSKYRGAVDSGSGTNAVPDLSGISQILGLITSGQANNIVSLATQIMSVAPSLVATATGGGNTLDIIFSILQQALPILLSIAPQFAPVVTALMAIIPMVQMFVALFKKKPKPSATPSPTPSPTAFLFNHGFVNT